MGDELPSSEGPFCWNFIDFGRASFDGWTQEKIGFSSAGPLEWRLLVVIILL